jgi:hypothetical protein
MNLNMQGQVFELAERYTNMTKILFLGLWYCSIYPGALFMTSFILFMNYFVGTYFKLCFSSVLSLIVSFLFFFQRSIFFDEDLEANSQSGDKNFQLFSGVLFPKCNNRYGSRVRLLLVRLPVRQSLRK